MKLVTRPNDISGLKILLAGEFLNVPIELTCLPTSDKTTLHVNECHIFSPNSAVWYLFCSAGHKRNNPPQDEWLEWECSVLNPEVQALLGKTPHQIENVLEHLDKSIHSKYIIGVSKFKDVTICFHN